MRSSLGWPFVLLLACGDAAPPPARPEPRHPPAARTSPAPRRPAFVFTRELRTSVGREVPLSLTASDGTGLAISSMKVRALVQAPLAFTELELTFQNPEDRIIEGQFRIALPQGASLSRFAMMIDGRWQEGEVVELQAARRAYEDFLHQKQDPALLEQGAGNEFAARVFPIPARGQKKLIISYSQDLASGDTPYTLPLVGLPELGELDVRVETPAGVVADRQKRVVPTKDLEIPLGKATPGLRAGNLVITPVVPVAETAPEALDSLMILVDTSASRALGYAAEVDTVSQLIAGLAAGNGPTTPVVVAAFDQGVELMYEGPASGFSADKLLARRPLGASDLGGAIAWAAEHRGASRLLVVSDGVATAGVESQALRDQVRALGAAGITRVDALAVGGIRDEAQLANLTRAGLEADGAIIDGKLPLTAIADKLTRKTRSAVTLNVEHALWSWPTRVDGAQAGEPVLVFAELPAGQPLAISVDGKPVVAGSSDLVQAEPALVARAAARARIAALLEERDRLAADDKARDTLKQQIIATSIEHRVMSPFTALLVLESEADYRRFHLDRKALSSILTVGEHGLAVVDRAHSAPLGRTTVKPPEPADRTKAVTTPPPVDPRAQASVGRGTSFGAGGASYEARGAAMAAPAMRIGVASDERELSLDAPVARPPAEPARPEPEKPRVAPYTGKLAQVMRLLKKDREAALTRARAWHEAEPGDVLALIALGEALEATEATSEAARAYGSLIDLFPARADLRRFAGERLDRLAGKSALALAIDSYRHAAAQRPDHPASHRLLAFALVRNDDPEGAFAAIAEGIKQKYPDDRFRGVDRILREDAGLIAAAWIAREPARKEEIMRKLEKLGGRAEQRPSIRFVLNWETDANDVDFHIHDGQGNHAYYSDPELASGGTLYADVTTGYGPECFTIRGAHAFPYRLEAHYYSRGPMGYGMGKLEIIRHDGKGGLTFEERPFVIMQDDAFVNLGTVKR